MHELRLWLCLVVVFSGSSDFELWNHLLTSHADYPLSNFVTRNFPAPSNGEWSNGESFRLHTASQICIYLWNAGSQMTLFALQVIDSRSKANPFLCSHFGLVSGSSCNGGPGCAKCH